MLRGCIGPDAPSGIRPLSGSVVARSVAATLQTATSETLRCAVQRRRDMPILTETSYIQ